MAIIDLDIRNRFYLDQTTKRDLYQRKEKFGFGVLGASVYARTYSRLQADGSQERWADTVIRVVEGLMTMRKWWYVRSRLKWDQTYWANKASQMADAMFNFRFLPAGRSLWAMGSEHTYELGSMALNNCAFLSVTHLEKDTDWIADALMLGVGVGFDTHRYTRKIQHVQSENPEIYVIPDSREGWARAIGKLAGAYETGGRDIRFDYSQVRPAGLPIKGFGGISSGPDPLEKGIERMRQTYERAANGEISNVRLVTDIINIIGTIVVSGNVRRSAEIALGSPQDEEFINLKNYEKNPDRADIAWMSNNSVMLETYEDFKYLPAIANGVRENGEPGIFNLINIQKYGRYGEHSIDTAIGANPCGEIALESAELCCLSEVFPTRCVDAKGNFSEALYFEAIELATLYASTVSLIPTHSEETNAVIARNHRIGVSMSGIADWMAVNHATNIISWLDRGYQKVREVNSRLAKEAGVRESIRVTTVKPSGTISILAGVSSGMHLPPFSRYLRRVRMSKNAPVAKLLQDANVPFEDDVYSDNTYVFEFPVDQGKVRGQKDVSVWAKAQTVIMLQKFWADNMVSNTLSFDPKREGGQIEDLLTYVTPFIKTISLLPLPDEGSVYQQAPIEQITLDEFKKRSENIQDIDWSTFGDSDGDLDANKFCSNDNC